MSTADIRRLDEALAGHYRVEAEIGEGGMATVYLAHDLRHDRKVALKVLRPEVAAAVGSDRFLREIRIAARLNHPNIVGLIDSGEADGLLYYVMFYVEGESLRERLERETQLPLEEALRIAGQVGDALSYAHERGVVHRDVKPDNILLEGGHARVADFGIAKAVTDAGSEELTRTGLAVGTPTYMSPEQAGGGEADARADLYSLACVVYEMLSGSPPFTGATPSGMLARKVMEKPPGLRVVRSAVPEGVEAALERALDPTPADRQASVAAFLEELSSPASRATAVSGDGDGGSRWAGRGKVAAGVAVVGTLAAMAWMALDGGQEPPVLVGFRQITQEPGVEEAPCPSPDGEWVVYAAEDGGDRDIFLRSMGGQNPILLTPDAPGDDTQPAFSPDGDLIAFRSDRSGGGIFVMGRTGEGVRRVTDDGYNPAWSPDGTRLVYTLEDVGITPLNIELRSDLYVVSVQGDEPVALGVFDGVDPSWSPGGHRIAYAARAHEPDSIGARLDILTVPADGGAPVPVTADDANDWHPAWSADGRHLYFVSDRGGSMNLWRVAIDERSGRVSGEPQAVTAPSQFVAHPCVSADGRHIVFSNLVTTTQNVQRIGFDPATGTVGEPTWVTRGTRRWANPDPDSDASRLTLYSQDRPEGDLYVIERTEGGAGGGAWSDPRQLTSDPAIDRVPRWAPGDDLIAYFSDRAGTLDVWTIRPDGSQNRQITFGGAGTPSWSPDGSRLAAGPPERSRIGVGREPWSDGPVDTLPNPEGEAGRFAVNAWSPDGAYLVGSMDYRDSGILVYSMTEGSYRRLTDFGQWPVFLPDGRRILFVSGGNAFYVVDMRTGEVENVYSTPWDVLGPPRIPEDGRVLFFTRRVTEGDVWLATLG